jgi:hypothetical protein
MRNEEKIKEEVGKTLNAFDYINDLEESSELKEKDFLKGKILRPAILFIIVVINILTGVYFIDSGSRTSTATKQQYFSKISSEYTLSHSYYSGINQTTGN